MPEADIEIHGYYNDQYNFFQEINHIDKELDGQNEMLVKEHLDNCSDCRREYEEIKSAIDYVVENSNNIDTKKHIRFKFR